ncbi:MAG: ABC transporter substrate-binding protein [Coriobacteriia bacterium]
MRTRMLYVLLVTALAVAVAGCAPDAEGPEVSGGGQAEAVVVGSKIDTEGGVLGQMIIALLENEGIEVEDRTRTGATDVVRSALESGEIDIYPEYTGTALSQFFPEAEIADGVSADGQESWDAVRELDADNGIVWLERAPANNTWAIAIPRALSEAEGITTLEEWASYINGGGEVKLVGSQEFVDREDALPAFEEAYEFDLSGDQLIILAGGDTAQTEAAAAQGTDGANAAMAYGTDGSLAALDLIVLSDPLGVQPVYEPAPTVRAEVLEAYPRIADVLDPVFRSLTLETLQELNGRVAVEGLDPRQVARDYLRAEGHIEQ